MNLATTLVGLRRAVLDFKASVPRLLKNALPRINVFRESMGNASRFSVDLTAIPDEIVEQCFQEMCLYGDHSAIKSFITEFHRQCALNFAPSDPKNLDSTAIRVQDMNRTAQELRQHQVSSHAMGQYLLSAWSTMCRLRQALAETDFKEAERALRCLQDQRGQEERSIRANSDRLRVLLVPIVDHQLSLTASWLKVNQLATELLARLHACPIALDPISVRVVPAGDREATVGSLQRARDACFAAKLEDARVLAPLVEASAVVLTLRQSLLMRASGAVGEEGRTVDHGLESCIEAVEKAKAASQHVNFWPPSSVEEVQRGVVALKNISAFEKLASGVAVGNLSTLDRVLELESQQCSPRVQELQDGLDAAKDIARHDRCDAVLRMQRSAEFLQTARLLVMCGALGHRGKS